MMRDRDAVNVIGSSTLFASNVLVCTVLFILRHSAGDAGSRTLYLVAANAIAGLIGFLPFRKENAIRLDGSTIAVAVWSTTYCAEYGLFLVYPGVISLSQLMVCNSLAPYAAVYLSRDVARSTLTGSYRFVSIVPVFFLLGISWLERNNSNRSSVAYADLILLCVFLSVVISQSCARYVSRHRSPSWSQPRLTLANAVFLTMVIGIARLNSEISWHQISIGICFFAGMSVLLIQRMYIFGLKKADPFISAMTLCTIVPLSLAMDILFEHRPFGLTEIALAIGYMLTMALNVNSQAELRPIE